MEIPVGEARARFVDAMAAAERGETVIFTRDGRAVLQLLAAGREAPSCLPDAGVASLTKHALGFEPDEEIWPEEFDDAAVSRKALGLE